MKEKLLEWAKAGDGDAMYKLAQEFRTTDFEKYREWLEKSAATENFFAMKEFAEVLSQDDEKKSVELQKKIVSKFRDSESMEILVDMCEKKNDRETLNFVLKIIEKMFNDIYTIDGGNIIARTLALRTRRHNEFTFDYGEAVERRRIASRIRKILSAE